MFLTDSCHDHAVIRDLSHYNPLVHLCLTLRDNTIRARVSLNSWLFTIYRLGKWYANFRTGKFRPAIRTNKFHLLENDREGLKLVSKMAWKNGTRISAWNIPSGKTELPFQMFRGSWKFSAGTTKKSCSIYFQTGFSGIFL